MAFRRSLTARAKLFYQQQHPQRVAIPLARADRDDNDRRRQDLQIHDFRRGVGGNAGWRNSCGDRRFAAPAAYAPLFHVRNMSSNGEGRGAENVPIATDSLEAVANEAATGLFPAEWINHVLTLSDCNWLATIALSTILARTLLLPFAIHQTKARSIYNLIRHRPLVKEIEEEISKSRNEKNPTAVAVGKERMRKLYNEFGISKFSSRASLIGSIFVHCILFDAISAVTIFRGESVNDGGEFLIYQFLTAFTFWRAMKCHGSVYIGGAAAALILPLTAFLPKGVLCYWIASNVYGLAYGTVMKNVKVKKMLGIPNVREVPPFFDTHPFLWPASAYEWIVAINLLISNLAL